MLPSQKARYPGERKAGGRGKEIWVSGSTLEDPGFHNAWFHNPGFHNRERQVHPRQSRIPHLPCQTAHARYFILGGKEATGVANKAIFAYRCADDQVAEASGPPPPPHTDTIWDQPAVDQYPEDRSPAELGRGPPKPPIYEDYGVRLRRDLGLENAHRPFIPKNLCALCALCGESCPPAPGCEPCPD